MGLMDRVKAQASQLAQQAQDAAQEGRAKLDQAQSNRRGDILLRQLGVLVYLDRTGRGSPDTQAKIEQVLNDINAHERQNGLNLSEQPQAFPFQGQSAQQPGQPAQPFGGPPPGAGPAPQPSTQFPGPASTQFPDDPSTPPAGGMPSVDTNRQFFPRPEDPAPDAGPSGEGVTGFPPEA
jgi:hypothetical protein